MSREYDEYIVEHRKNVSKGFRWLFDNLPEIINRDNTFFAKDCIAPNILAHDQSKYESEEYDAYDKYFYGKNRSYQVVEDFNYAWLHHIHNNPHHWQYWILINDDSKNGMTVLDMPYKYIIEMICDWWSFSWAKDNLYEIFSWYEARKDYIKLSNNTRKTVEDILDKIKNKLNEVEKNET